MTHRRSMAILSSSISAPVNAPDNQTANATPKGRRKSIAVIQSQSKIQSQRKIIVAGDKVTSGSESDNTITARSQSHALDRDPANHPSGNSDGEPQQSTSLNMQNKPRKSNGKTEDIRKFILEKSNQKNNRPQSCSSTHEDDKKSKMRKVSVIRKTKHDEGNKFNKKKWVKQDISYSSSQEDATKTLVTTSLHFE